MWTALAAVAAISLLLFWRGPNAVWGGVTLGAVGGFIFALVVALRGSRFHWAIVGKGLVVGVLLGSIAEIIGRLANRAKRLEEQE